MSSLKMFTYKFVNDGVLDVPAVVPRDENLPLVVKEIDGTAGHAESSEIFSI